MRAAFVRCLCRSAGWQVRHSMTGRTLASASLAMRASKRKSGEASAAADSAASPTKRSGSSATGHSASLPHPPYHYTALVTGANRGLGLEFVRQLAQRYQQDNSTIYAGCRKPDEASALQQLARDHPNIHILPPLDITDAHTIRHTVNTIQQSSHSYLCLLVNNSGVASRNHPDDPTLEIPQDDFQYVYNVNVGGTLQMFQHTHPLLEAAKKQMHASNSATLPATHRSPTVINVSSNLASIAANQMGSRATYRCSKAALNMLTATCAVDFRDILFVAQSPGWAQTDMGGEEAPLTASQSVQEMLALWERLTLEDSGSFLDYDGKQQPW